MYSKEEVQQIKDQFTKTPIIRNTEIRNDIFVPVGRYGKVVGITDEGMLQVDWGNGYMETEDPKSGKFTIQPGENPSRFGSISGPAKLVKQTDVEILETRPKIIQLFAEQLALVEATPEEIKIFSKLINPAQKADSADVLSFTFDDEHNLDVIKSLTRKISDFCYIKNVQLPEAYIAMAVNTAQLAEDVGEISDASNFYIDICKAVIVSIAKQESGIDLPALPYTRKEQNDRLNDVMLGINRDQNGLDFGDDLGDNR